MEADTYQPPLQTRPLTTNADAIKSRRPLRLWPAVVLAVLLVVFRFVIPAVAPNAIIMGMPATLTAVFGGLLSGVAILAWWLLFSRAPWVERIGVFVVMAIGLFMTYRLVHVSIAGGAMGYLLPVLALPIVSLALVIWAVASRHLAASPRRITMVATIFLALGLFTLIRTGGFTGDFVNDLHWRWSKSPEERLLAKGDEPTVAPSNSTAAITGYDWPGFRGLKRDGVVRGVRLESDWTKSPPKEMWRRPVGPGWSSFAVHGDFVYTQEQRGTDELVACYSLSTGQPVWRHRDAARFYESNAGAGPRGTPTFNNNRVYTLGATGILNALDAASGNVIWSRNAAAETKAKRPGWGFSSSPLVVGDVVIVATAGTLAAYDVTSGAPRWYGPNGGDGYSSPQLVEHNGVTQVVLQNGPGAIGVAPTDGKVLWEYSLPSGTRIIQPAVTAEGDLVLSVGDGNEMHRIRATNASGAWTVQEMWASAGLSPFFNDFVVNGEHAYGFAGSKVGCMDLKDGELKWSGGNYGHGQLVVLSDAGLLLVLSEAGEIALVKASPDGFTELGRIPAIKGKTWNHPVLVNDVLLVRNGEEMAAFKLALARS